ncbi:MULTISPECIES: tRNA (adenosine(37)-N6)-threonylcarbamoyltransferase complex dimerization subunit type 1 TsaB [unclassified Thioalkalivibrio]|uniref:tRNA (adenosine(37)-N6)-threonylcarbamoyltransferase complex dimerization subunit type 1 TsaB n=1 Tax=unclassified Thioalkalivibrio TaxID=2621013 RepID=UPI00037F9171|nr:MULTISPECIES: tRNA (adenosine(37)-N6)-threonylcarbamoyltransferase complex dimerization subunit type 1 TsaB [unclassified Thioalkalivibrio]
MRLIAIETCTEMCSAALWVDGVLDSVEAQAPRKHGELILRQVEELLARADIARTSLDAVAVGRGPGAFTGVRLGLGAAQGMAFALDRPVLPISTLQALAQQLVREEPETSPEEGLAAIDARMGEVYWSLNAIVGGRAQSAQEQVSAPSQVLPAWRGSPQQGIGSGFLAYPELLERSGLSPGRVYPDALPRAREVAMLAVDAWERGEAIAPEHAQPVYLRDNVAEPSRPRGSGA